MKRLIIALGLGVLASSSASAATFDDGNTVYSKCKEITPSSQVRCLATTGAFFDMMQSLGYQCRFAENATRQQVADVFTKYLTDHPESRNQDAARLAFLAFKTAFGCELKLNP
jgi:hypothetical protein